MDLRLNPDQLKLFEEHLDYVNVIIRCKVNLNITNVEYADLYQEGCIGLCKAAKTYNGSVQFKTYASTVIRNHLYSYLRKINKIHFSEAPGEFVEEEVDTSEDPVGSVLDTVMIEEYLGVLRKQKRKESGYRKKGLEALEMRIRDDYSLKQIAEIYGVKDNQVSAWISAAKKNVESSIYFKEFASQYVFADNSNPQNQR